VWIDDFALGGHGAVGGERGVGGRVFECEGVGEFTVYCAGETDSVCIVRYIFINNSQLLAGGPGKEVLTLRHLAFERLRKTILSVL